ncbi:hypothetical protein CLU81_0800 [Flavobacterium sp. 9]|nr:hypothetical protein CLU81_0800 [Flavobacterium sp. 9]
MFGWANIQNQNLFVGVLGREIFFFDLGERFSIEKQVAFKDRSCTNKIFLNYGFPYKFSILDFYF